MMQKIALQLTSLLIIFLTNFFPIIPKRHSMSMYTQHLFHILSIWDFRGYFFGYMIEFIFFFIIVLNDFFFFLRCLTL